MKLSRNAKIMLLLLALAIVTGVFNAIGQAMGLQFPYILTDRVVLLALIVLLALHSTWQVGLARAPAFFLLAASLGLGFEVWGLRGGSFFGGHYVYNGSGIKLWEVPYIIPIYWVVFIYTAYSISNAFLAWLGHHKPSKNSSQLGILVSLITLDGLLTVALDLILDPIQVRQGTWTWLDHGAYFGVPIGNFIGWFIVTVLVTGTFRLYEYLRPGKEVSDTYLLLIPVIGYGMLGVGLGLSAAAYGMYFVAVLSIVVVTAPAIGNVVLYLSQKRKNRSYLPK